MSEAAPILDQPFLHGAEWVRADFHMHTRADKEFKYAEHPDHYVSGYVTAVEEAGIKFGVITNHNKFDRDEFLSLKKTARRKGICLLPGVELSVKDGHNGVHTLVVFSEAWIEQGADLINQFLGNTFAGRPSAAYENENERSNDDLLTTLGKLQRYERDFFVMFAHVEDRSGLWNEMGGGMLQQVGADPGFRRHTLGFQKVRTRDERTKVQRWLQDWYPAEVEGSDPKCIGEIGKGQPCFVKVGELSFDALMFALRDHAQRVRSTVPAVPADARIHQIAFTGGRLSGKTYSFSNQLTSLIGSRGSGKSAVIECLRYGLNFPSGPEDERYKNSLVGEMLRNGGELRVSGTSATGAAFEIVRVAGLEPAVRLEGKETRLRPADILPGVLYFGQKDLGNRHDRFEEEFFEKLLGTPAPELRAAEEAKVAAVKKAIENYHVVLKAKDKGEEYAHEAEKLKLQFEQYEKHGVAVKLESLTRFDSDKREFAELCERLTAAREGLDGPAAEFSGELTTEFVFKSESLTDHQVRFQQALEEVLLGTAGLGKAFATIDAGLRTMNDIAASIQNREQQLMGDFAALQRQVNAPGLNLDQFRQQKSRHEQLIKLLQAAGNRKQMAETALAQVHGAARSLHDYWRELHRREQQTLQSRRELMPEQIALSLDYQADREAFGNFLKAKLQGSGFRASSYEKVLAAFPDALALFERRHEISQILEGSVDGQKLGNAVMEHLTDLLTFRVPDRRGISFNGTAIAELSLGQRATALLLLVMSLNDHPIIIIDQPEDDLDNETIFKQVVGPLLANKQRTQFIVATHNPNIPVLGDAELVHACHEREKGQFDKASGSLDSATTREQIVAIMEGGAAAFEQRHKIYSQWTNSLSAKNS